MKWRNPKVELPEDNQMVFAMLEPHKNRGTLLQSACSIQIVAGWADVQERGVMIENQDEYGHGSVRWVLFAPRDGETASDYAAEDWAIAWLPIEEMVFPDFEDPEPSGA